MDYIKDIFLNIGLRDILDIFIVAFILYKSFMLIRGTRAEQLLKGILVLLVATQLSRILHLYTVYWIFEKVMNYGVFAVLIVFQDELRRALEKIGTKSLINIDRSVDGEIETVNQICDAIEELANHKIGALIVIEKETGLNEIAKTGTLLDSEVSSAILVNIFTPNTPLHDGATIISDDRIKAAGCFLPLSESFSIKKTLGTRHRAALGISERSDSLSIVVSEETGTISIAENGKLNRPLSVDQVREILGESYTGSKNKGGLFMKWRNKDEKHK